MPDLDGRKSAETLTVFSYLYISRTRSNKQLLDQVYRPTGGPVPKVP